MKVCPRCDYLNEDRFPTCIWCNAVITEVKSTPHPDPNHPENLEKALAQEWRVKWRKERRGAMLVYCLGVTFLAAFPGGVFRRDALVLYFLSAVLVALAVDKGIAGRTRAGILQGFFVVSLVFKFGPIHPFTFFMLPAQIMIAMLLVYWLELIRDVNR